MPLVVRDLILQARDEHPTFNNRRHPDPVLLRALSRYQRELLGRIIRLDVSQAVVQLDTPLPLADFHKGIAVFAYKYPYGCEVSSPGSKKSHPVDVVSWQDAHRYLRAVFLLDNVLYLTGKPQHWDQFNNIRFYYVPEPDALPSVPGATLDYLPDSAENCLVLYLAAKMAGRGGAGDGEAPPDAGAKAAEWQLAEERFLDEVSRRTQAVTSTVKDVF